MHTLWKNISGNGLRILRHNYLRNHRRSNRIRILR